MSIAIESVGSISGSNGRVGLGSRGREGWLLRVINCIYSLTEPNLKSLVWLPYLNQALARSARCLGSSERLGGASLKHVTWSTHEALGLGLTSPECLGKCLLKSLVMVDMD